MEDNRNDDEHDMEDSGGGEDYSSSDYSSSDDEDMGYGNLLQHALLPLAGGVGAAAAAATTATAAGPPPALVDTRTPSQKWNDFLNGIQTRRTKVLKLTDRQLEQDLQFLLDNSLETLEEKEAHMNQLIAAVTAEASFLTHVMIGPQLLSLLEETGLQKSLFHAIFGGHHETLSFVLLKGTTVVEDGRCNNNQKTVLDMRAVMETLGQWETPALSEMELEGIKFSSLQDIQQFSTVLEQKKKSLRQINMIGIIPVAKEGTMLPVGWLDPILLALSLSSNEETSPLDELKLVINSNNKTNIHPAITPKPLQTLLMYKKKWWRLGLDGLGLTDEHLAILTNMFSRDDACKAGDLLSLQDNPSITAKAYQDFFEGCFFWKRRMGLIKVDNKEWEAQFDLVRSMNNLHNRLDYVCAVVEKGKESSNNNNNKNNKTCSHHKYTAGFASRDNWVEWLVKLGTGLPWEDDKHRLNYLWFTLLEKPEFIYSNSSSSGVKKRSFSSSLDWSSTNSSTDNSNNVGRPPRHLQDPPPVAAAAATAASVEVESQIQGPASGLGASMAQHHQRQHYHQQMHQHHHQQAEVYRPQHPHDPQSQQQHGLFHHRQQMSPTFQHRSSPIAIIHNPEDGSDQAKIRYQHPMYDTSDDELDIDDDLFYASGGESLASRDNNHRSPYAGGKPQSLPTNLLRAPKLGSIPSQDYRLQHLTSLPPPLCLNDDDSSSAAAASQRNSPFLIPAAASGQSLQQLSQSPRHKPSYLSSYGSLRESHLTGRFGGRQQHQAAASTGNLTDRRVRFEQPGVEPPSTLGTLIPPKGGGADVPHLAPVQPTPIPTPTEQSPQPTQQQQPTLSIRDRMLQKVHQQQKEKRESDDNSVGKQPPSSSLSAMLEQQQQQSNSQTSAAAPAIQPASPKKTVVPAGLAHAVAVSYNSNMDLLYNSRRQQQQEQESSLSPDNHNNNTDEMLSSSMTGLEILRHANRNHEPLARPTSLSILQGSSGSGLVLPVPPPPAFPPGCHVGGNSSNHKNSGDHYFAPLARTYSEPSPHWASAPTTFPQAAPTHQQATNANSSSQFHTSLSSPSLLHQNQSNQQQQQQQLHPQYQQHGSFVPVDASTLIPPRTVIPPARTIPTMPIQQQQVLYPQDAWTTTTTTTMDAAPSNHHGVYQHNASSYHQDTNMNGYPAAMNHPAEGSNNGHDDYVDEHHNPDMEGAFDMDLE